jgi:Rrf2 family protein
VKLADISARQNLPIAYLEQLFRQLRIGGVVKSVRGPGGGYVLAKEATETTIGDVFKAVQETVSYIESVSTAHPTMEFDKVSAAVLKLDAATQQFLNTNLASLS